MLRLAGWLVGCFATLPAAGLVVVVPASATRGHQKILGIALCRKFRPSSASSLGDDRHAHRLIGLDQNEHCLSLQEHASAVIGNPGLFLYHVDPLLLQPH